MPVIQGPINEQIMEIENYMFQLNEIPDGMENCVVVDEIKNDFPPPEKGMYHKVYYELVKKEFFVQAFERPLTPEEELEKEIKEIRLMSSQTNKIDYYEQMDKEKATLEEVRTAKFDALKEVCDNEILKGFYSPSMDATFGFSFTDQMNITQQMIVFILDPAPIMWKTEDKGLMEITKEQFIQIAYEAGAHKQKQIMRWWQLKAIVITAQTKEEIIELEW